MRPSILVLLKQRSMLEYMSQPRMEPLNSKPSEHPKSRPTVIRIRRAKIFQALHTRIRLSYKFSVSLLAFHKISSDVLIPIYLASPAAKLGNRPLFPRNLENMNRGVGLSTIHVGYFLPMQAAVAIVAQIFWFQRSLLDSVYLGATGGQLYCFHCSTL